MDNAWAIELGPTIYSIVKAKATEQLKDKYPTLNVTDKGEIGRASCRERV